MSLFVFSALVALAAPPASAESSSALQTPHQLRTAIRLALRQQALADTKSERTAAIREQCRLHDQLMRDEQMSQDARKQWISKLRNRLRRTQHDLKIQLARQQKQNSQLKETVSLHTGEQYSHDFAATLAIVSAPLGWASVSMGGPAAIFARTGAGHPGGGTVADNGQALIQLIQKTISPSTWDVNGGNGSIVYFAPLHALVVRAPSDIHRRTGGLLEQLRDAGR